MAKWVEYTGSDEQIREIKANTHGYMVRNIPPITGFILSPRIRYAFELSGISEVKFEYLICQPHPHADIIKIWADTGCEVWVRLLPHGLVLLPTGSYKIVSSKVNKGIYTEHTITTNTPYLDIPGAEYRLTPFED